MTAKPNNHSSRWESAVFPHGASNGFIAVSDLARLDFGI
jgi:hypothetical protein